MTKLITDGRPGEHSWRKACDDSLLASRARRTRDTGPSVGDYLARLAIVSLFAVAVFLLVLVLTVGIQP